MALVACGEPVDTRDEATTLTSTGSPSTETTDLTTTATTTPTTTTTTTTSQASPATSNTSTTTSSLPAGGSRATVVRVVDGDTIDIDGGSEDTVRLIGINSPEGGECFADEATRGLEDLIGGATIHLEADVTDRDQFGRLLRYVWTTDDRFVNEIAVERGWALAREYPPDTSRAGELQSAQNRAVDSGAGLWAEDACGEAVPSDVQIVHVEYDAPGDDNSNLNGEWVDISNQDEVPVDLTGWVLKDESATHRFSFPGRFTLAPGSMARVHTGCGDDSAESLYWCVTGSAVWNNSGDTAFLLDPDGNIVFSFAYE